MNHKQHRYDTAYGFLGKDASPRDLAPDGYGCAETVSDIIRKAFPELNFPTVLSTRDLYHYLINSPSFRTTNNPSYGCIIVSVTGTGNGRVENGHTGIFGERTGPDGTLWIMSNDSRTGTFEANYTLDGWIRFYEDKGGLVTQFFEPA